MSPYIGSEDSLTIGSARNWHLLREFWSCSLADLAASIKDKSPIGVTEEGIKDYGYLRAKEFAIEGDSSIRDQDLLGPR